MALISNGTTVASGGNVQAPTLTGNLPALNASSLTNVPSSAPTSSQVGSANAGLSTGSVGTYGFCGHAAVSGSNKSPGSTTSGSNLSYLSGGGSGTGSWIGSGTWRCMGYADVGQSLINNVTVWMRIS